MPTYGYLLATRGSVLASDDDEELAARTDADVLGLAATAEALGFSSVWVGDSVLARSRHDPLSTLAAVGGYTDALDLGTAVYLPTLRQPVAVAHRVASVDQLTGGRLAPGVGVSSATAAAEAEHANLGVPFERRGARLNELLEIVTRLWAGEQVDFEGEHYSVKGAELGFGPLREPPIYVATGGYHPEKGFPETVRERIMNYGDGYLPNVMAPETYAQSLAYIHDLLDEAGRDASSFDPAYYLDVVVSDDEASALEEARRFYDRYYADREPFTDEEIRNRGAFGPPATVSETLDAYAEAGVETMVVRLATRNQRQSLRKLAELL